MKLEERVDRMYERILDLSRKSNNREREKSVVHFLEQLKSYGINYQSHSIPWWMVRTTNRNYDVLVPGELDDEILFIAHYDSFALLRAPGADDNASGVALLEEMLLQDIASKPRYTHRYVFSGSEECGHLMFYSMLALLGASFVVPYSAAFLLPFFCVKLGTTGSAEYAKSCFKTMHLKKLKAVLAIDSVGSGDCFVIPRYPVSASLAGSIIPYKRAARLDKIIKKSAWELGYKTKDFLLGGTTDHVSFIEKVPALTILLDKAGKSSPVIVGGKLHTSSDSIEMIEKDSLAAALSVVQRVVERIEHRVKEREPFKIEDGGFANLYRICDGSENFVLCLRKGNKDGQHPVNSVYLCDAKLEGKKARVGRLRFLDWGVERTLDEEVSLLFSDAQRLKVSSIELGRGIVFKRDKRIGQLLNKYLCRISAAVGHIAEKYQVPVLGATALCAAASSSLIVGKLALSCGLGLNFFYPLSLAIAFAGYFPFIKYGLPGLAGLAKAESRYAELSALSRLLR